MCNPVSLAYIMTLSIMPVSEVRGAIPASYILFNDANYMLCRYIGVSLAIVGNMIIVPVILITLQKIERYILRSNHTLIKNIYISITERVRSKAQKYIDRYGIPGLIIFVSIPLPTTGAWSGSLAAHIFGMSIIRSIIAIEIGILIASTIVILSLEFIQLAIF